MSIYRLVAPNDGTSVIGTLSDPHHRTRIVLGIGYTESPATAEWASAHGYTVEEVVEVPSDHLQKVARLDAYPLELRGGTNVDAADPNSKYRFIGPDGHTAVDIRDVLSGAVTA